MNDSEKFPYGYDVESYIDKAIEKMKYTYPWASRACFCEHYSFAVEETEGGHVYVWYSVRPNEEPDRHELDCDGEGFIEEIINDNCSTVESANPVAETLALQSGHTLAGGWNLERYEIRKHRLGGYSAFVQAGDRSAGASRTFFIPPSYFEGSYDEFLDRFTKLVPPYFGFGREELAAMPDLKAFFGY